MGNSIYIPRILRGKTNHEYMLALTVATAHISIDLASLCLTISF